MQKKSVSKGDIYYKKAIKKARYIFFPPEPIEVAELFEKSGNYYILEDNKEKAYDTIYKAVEYYQKTGHCEFNISLCLQNLAKIFNYPKNVEILHNLIKIRLDNGVFDENSKIWQQIAHAHKNELELKKELDALIECIKCERRINYNNHYRITELFIEFENYIEAKKIALELLESDNSQINYNYSKLMLKYLLCALAETPQYADECLKKMILRFPNFIGKNEHTFISNIIQACSENNSDSIKTNFEKYDKSIHFDQYDTKLIHHVFKNIENTWIL